VDTVDDGNEVLNALHRAHYDLILMDCMMPGVDGYQATRLIRSSKTLGPMSAIPIIALTANGSKEARQRCSDAGMNDFIAKPIDFEVLVATVEKWLAAPASERA
jgi:CheY-like chemotaxis protein